MCKKLVNDELESLREKRKKELLALSLKKELTQKKQEEENTKEKERQIRATMIVNQVLEPDAQIYMEWLSKNNPPVAQTIKETVILILHKNLLAKPLSKIDLMRIERELIGKEPEIKVKRRGKQAVDLNMNIKKELEDN